MGGRMAEQRKRTRVPTAEKKAVEKRAVKPAERKTGNKKAAATSPSAPQGDRKGVGIEELRSAVQDELRERGKQIARKLRIKSVSGDTQATKLLIALATKPTAKVVAKAESVALEIAADPEWRAEATEGTQVESPEEGGDAEQTD